MTYIYSYLKNFLNAKNKRIVERVQEATHLARAALCTVLGGPGAAQTRAESRGGRHHQRRGRGQLGIVRSEEEGKMINGRWKVQSVITVIISTTTLSPYLIYRYHHHHCPLLTADLNDLMLPHLSRSSSCCSAGASSAGTGACSGRRGRP